MRIRKRFCGKLNGSKNSDMRLARHTHNRPLLHPVIRLPLSAFLLVFCCLVALTGCSRKMPVLQKFSSPPEQAACKIAILPFTDQGSYPEGSEIFYKIFFTELVSSGHFTVIPEGNVRDLYKQLKMYPNRQPRQDQLEIIGGRLGATLFIGGDILSMKEESDGTRKKTQLTVVLHLYDARTGKIFWATYHRRQGHEYHQVLHFGRINTITTLARQMADEIIDLWRENGLQSCPSK